MLRQLTLLALLAAAPTTALAQTSAALFDGFNTPVNKGGWSYNPGDTWEVAGGNPGGWWHQPVADTFAPIIVATNAALTGDFRAKGVTQLSFDAQLLGVDFGTGNGMNMSVLLRDTKGTGTSRPASSVIAILDDGVLEIVTVGGGPADLIHVTDPPSSGLK